MHRNLVITEASPLPSWASFQSQFPSMTLKPGNTKGRPSHTYVSCTQDSSLVISGGSQQEIMLGGVGERTLKTAV